MGRHRTRIIASQPVTQMWEHHKEIARLEVSGLTPSEIAKKMNFTQAWISTIRNSPVYREHLAKLSARADDSAVSIRKQIEEGAKTGVQELLLMLKGDTKYQDIRPSLKVKIAQDFLDRNGNAKVSRVQSESTQVVLDAARIEQLRQKREQMLSRLGGSTVDITPKKPGVPKGDSANSISAASA